MTRKPTIDTESAAHDQIRAFVERILRMREEAKAINDDIREIYAEAKGNGFDKTVLGQIVSHIEKRAKDPDTLAERSALFDLYLSAIDGAPHAPARTREIIEEFGDDVAADEADGPGPHEPAVAADQAGADAPIAQPELSAPVNQSTAARMDVPHVASSGEQPRALAIAGTQARPVDTIPVRPTAADQARGLRPWCQHANDLNKCAGFGRRHCSECLKIHADEVGEAA
jgi:uncharacterized protein (UPF0335 family)